MVVVRDVHCRLTAHRLASIREWRPPELSRRLNPRGGRRLSPAAAASGAAMGTSMDRALFLLGADVPPPVVAKSQVVVKTLSNKEKAAADLKKKEEAKRKKIADALLAGSGAKPKLTKSQAAAAKAKEENGGVEPEPEAKPEPKAKPKPVRMRVDTGIAQKTLSAPMPEKVVTYSSRTVEQMALDNAAIKMHAAVQARKRQQDAEKEEVRKHIAARRTTLTLDDWALLQCAVVPEIVGADDAELAQRGERLSLN